MDETRVALVTGANQGIGLEIVRELAAQGLVVFLGSRDPARGEQAATGLEGDVRALQLDVTDPASIAAGAQSIDRAFGRLDVLVNNAAISHVGRGPEKSFADHAKKSQVSNVALDEMRAVFETNVFGVVAVTQAMLPLLRKAPAGRIVNLSSGAASLTGNANPSAPFRHLFGPVYPASKTALNAVTLATAIELEGTNIKVNAAAPGATRTSMNNFSSGDSVEQGAREAVRLALIGEDGPNGTFSNAKGPLPW